jgi:fatty acid-binding protein DegV
MQYILALIVGLIIVTTTYLSEAEADEVINIPFTIEKDGISYSDAIHLTPEQFANMMPAEIQAMKQERFNRWKEYLDFLATHPQENETTLTTGDIQ